MPQNLLVIDDDDAVRSLLVTSLEGFGYSVAEAVDGASGVEAVRHRHFDLVIIDYAMPRMSGTEAAEAVRKVRPGQAVLLISGYAQTLVFQSQAEGMPILGKPFSQTELHDAVTRALA
jgi:CheY-like chemotaxis protein